MKDVVFSFWIYEIQQDKKVLANKQIQQIPYVSKKSDSPHSAWVLGGTLNFTEKIVV